MQSRNFCAASKFLVLVILFLSTLTATEAANTNTRLPRTAMTHMAYAPSVGSRNGLPATTMDSFVANAVKAGRGDAIYGDEGEGANPPPFFGFTAAHRINAGIVGQQDAGLSTGHGSRLPDAWGRDEYMGGQEYSQSGQNNGGYDLASSPEISVVASDVLPPVAPSFRNQPSRAYSTIGSGANAANQSDSGF